MGEATRLLFGDTTKEWPEGFCLVNIEFLSPELEQYLNESGVLVSRELEALVLITPESDREHLAQALLQIQVNEGNDQPELIGREAHPVPMEHYTTALMFSAALGDTMLLKTLLDLGADPNKRAAGGNTALMIAARHGHLDAVRILMHDPKTQVNLKNVYRESALFYAAAQGNVEVFSLLLVVGGAILEREGRVFWADHPLLVAAKNGHYAICKRLINTGMNVDLQDEHNGDTALQYATAEGKIECCKVLIDAGANVNHVNDEGYSILHTAIIRNQFEVFELLIARGAALTYGEDSPSLLTEAVLNGRFKLFKRLIELKVDINLVHRGKTALHRACKGGDLAATKALLEAGANPDIPDASGFNTLVYAARRGDVPLMSLLIKHGANIRSKHHFGYLALCEATKYGQLDAIKFLLKSGAPTVMPGMYLLRPYPPLLVSLMRSPYFSDAQVQDEALGLLLDNGASWREVDVRGQDALMYAVVGAPKLADRLLKAGATVGQTDVIGLNALEIAVQIADVALGTVLPLPTQYNLSINILLTVLAGVHRQANGGSLISAALQKAQHSVTRELLLQKFQVNPDFSEVYSPLDWEVSKVFPILRSACLDSTKDWDRTEFEIQLAAIGTPVPAINFYCDYVEAFPAMKVKLFGPINAEEVNQGYWTEFFMGIDGTMQTRLFVENEINRAYEGLGWESTRQVAGQVAQIKIDYAVDSAITVEQQRLTRFTEIFNNCLKSTLSAQSSQGLQPHTLPAAGMIAADLMGQWVYAALAEHIEKSWRTAWLATIKPEQEATETVFTADEYAAFGAESLLETAIPITVSAISEQQSSQLLQAFRNELRSNFRDRLKLPNASRREAALYVALMQRQLDMLMQSVKQTAEVQAPAPMTGSM